MPRLGPTGQLPLGWPPPATYAVVYTNIYIIIIITITYLELRGWGGRGEVRERSPPAPHGYHSSSPHTLSEHAHASSIVCNRRNHRHGFRQLHHRDGARAESWGPATLGRRVPVPISMRGTEQSVCVLESRACRIRLSSFSSIG